jgi:hypothetical protein
MERGASDVLDLGVTREDFVPVGVEVRFVGTGCRPT